MINLEFSSLQGLGENGSTHFFGAPMLTKKLAKVKFVEEEMFIAQINCAEIKPFDTENILPSLGIVYIFYDMFARKYTLFYDQDEPIAFQDGFNKKFDNNRYDCALKAELSNPDEEDCKKDCSKMLCEVPESVKKSLPSAEKYVCLLLMKPEEMDNLGRPYLLRLKECSCIVIKKKHLMKGKFSKAITCNV